MLINLVNEPNCSYFSHYDLPYEKRHILLNLWKRARLKLLTKMGTFQVYLLCLINLKCVLFCRADRLDLFFTVLNKNAVFIIIGKYVSWPYQNIICYVDYVSYYPLTWFIALPYYNVLFIKLPYYSKINLKMYVWGSLRLYLLISYYHVIVSLTQNKWN